MTTRKEEDDENTKALISSHLTTHNILFFDVVDVSVLELFHILVNATFLHICAYKLPSI